MTPESRDYGLLEQLADEFADRHRRGERPTVQEYVDKYPALAEDLREILPAMVELEKVQKVVAPPPTVEKAPTTEEQRVLGDFRLLREIGRGGMGVVYEAEQLSLGRRVALKVLTQKMLSDSKQKRRFEREARAAAKLHHTNIVPVFGFGDHDGVPYYVMQFIQGLGLEKVIEELAGMALAGKTTAGMQPPDASMRDVSAVSVAVSLLTGQFVPADQVEADEAAAMRTITAALHKGEPAVSQTAAQPPSSSSSPSSSSLPSTPSAASSSSVSSAASASSTASSVSLPGQNPETAAKVTYWQSIAKVGSQVADALEYAHKQGIIHRDIKPSNLLLDLTGTVWVADFGLAKADDQQDLTHTGDILGTLRYMPPEAFVGRVDARGDVYALGLTLFEMLALRPAFNERERHKLIGLVTNGTTPSLRSMRPDVPRDLETIIHKAIDRDPTRRYQTAGEMAADLRRFIADEPIRARRQSATEAAVRWARRHPGTAFLAGLIVLLMVGVTVGSAIAARHFDQLAEKAKQTATEAQQARDNEAKEREKAQAQEKETERQRKEAEHQQKEAERLKAVADEQRKATERQVARQYGETGSRLAADGDVAGALLWNVEALKVDALNSDTGLSGLVRTRLGQLLRQTPVPVHAWFHDFAVSSFVLDPAPEGRTVALLTTDGKVYLYDLITGVRTGPLASEKAIQSIEFSTDGSRLVTVTRSPGFAGPGLGGPGGGFGLAPDPGAPPMKDPPAPPPTPEIQVWNVRDGKALLEKGIPAPLNVSPGGFGGGYGNFGGGPGIGQFGGRNGRFAPVATTPVSKFFCLNNTRIVVCSGSGCKLYDSTTGKEVEEVFNQKEGQCFLQAVSPDGKRLLIRVQETPTDDDDPANFVDAVLQFGIRVQFAVQRADALRDGFGADVVRFVRRIDRDMNWATAKQPGGGGTPADFSGSVAAYAQRIQTAMNGGPGGFGPGIGGGFGPGGPSGGGFALARYYVVDISDPKQPKPWPVVFKVAGGAPRLYPSSVSFSPDGRYVLATDSIGLAIFDTAGNEVHSESATTQRDQFGPGGLGGLGGGMGGRGSPYPVTIFNPDSSAILIQELTSWGNFARTNTRIVELPSKKKTDLPQTVGTPIEFSPQGKYLLTQTSDRLVVFDVASATQLTQLPSELVFTSARFSGDGQYILVSGGDATLKVFSSNNGQRAVPWLTHESPVTQSQFTPDGSRVVTLAGQTLRVWPLARKARVVRTGSEDTLAFLNPDGSKFVTLTYDAENGQTVKARVWSAATGEAISNDIPIEAGSLLLRGGVFAGGRGSLVANGTFDPSGHLLLLQSLFIGANAVGVLDTQVGKFLPWKSEPPPNLDRNWQPQFTFTWAPVGPYLLSGTTFEDFRGGGWGGVESKRPKRPDSILTVLKADGTPAAAKLTFPTSVNAVWAPNGKQVFITTPAKDEWQCSLWDFETNKKREFTCPALRLTPNFDDRFGGGGLGGGRGIFPVVSFSAGDGKRILFYSQSMLAGVGTAFRIWDAETGQPVGKITELPGDTSGFGGSGFAETQLSPDGKVLFTIAMQQQNRGVRAIKVDDGTEISMMIPSEGLAGFAVSPEGDRVLTRSANSLQLWDVKTGNLITTPMTHESVIANAVFSSDGQRVIATTGYNPNVFGGVGGGRPGRGGRPGTGSPDIRIWDAATAQPILLAVGGNTNQDATPLGLRGAALLYDLKGTRVIQTTATGEVIIHDLVPDMRPVAELQLLAETLAARRVSGGGGLVVLKSSQLADNWKLAENARKSGWGEALVSASWYSDRISNLVESVPALSNRPFFGGGGLRYQPGLLGVNIRWHLERALALNPADKSKRIRGRLAHSQGDWEQALLDLIDLPGDPITGADLTRRAQAHAELGQWREAQRSFRAHLDSVLAPVPYAPVGGPVGGVTAFSRMSQPLQLTLVELKLSRSGEWQGFVGGALKLSYGLDFRRLRADVEAAYAENSAEYGLNGPRGYYEQYVWPTLLAGGEPAKTLVQHFTGKGVGYYGGGLVITSFPVEIAVYYRTGERANHEIIVQRLERTYSAEVGHSTPECFFLAMAAKQLGRQDLAEKALARAIAQMEGTAKSPPETSNPFGGPFNSEMAWQKRLANDLLRAEAEKLIRGDKKP